MRLLSKIVAGSVTAATLVALTAVPALADPPSGVTPSLKSAVGTGSDTTQYLLDQVAANFDKTSVGKKAPLYSWDAINPYTLAIGDNIVTKDGCTAIARPDGSGAGEAALEANTVDPDSPANSTLYCEDYARASSEPSSPPTCTTGGYCFVAAAGDAVTWAARDSASGGTDAPASLTTADLTSIYNCSVTNWDKFGGKDATILPYIPQTSSGTRSFFLNAIDVPTPGACVSDLPTTADPGGTLEENEGINPAFDNAAAIGIFSIGSFISQAYHSAPCTNTGCTEVSATQFPCSPSGTQNAFGCDETGYLGLGEINKIKPITGSGTAKAPYLINTDFPITFQRSLYDVVRYDPTSTNGDGIPGPDAGSPGEYNLEAIFSAKTLKVPGYICKDEAGVIKDYGFLPTWSLSSCGTVVNP
jgi:ABC-type phosphate transport system substrate-binding protein